MFGSEHVTREILGNVPRWAALGFYALAAAACGIAAWSFWRRRQRRQQGRRLEGAAAWSFDWRAWGAAILFQEAIRRDRFAGIAHLLVVYGFVILFGGTCLVFLEHDTPLHFFYGWFYQGASLVVDLGGVAFLAGLAMFLWRRHVVERAPILREWWVASLTWLLLAIGISGFLLEGARIARDLPDFERWSVVGYGLALLFRGIGLANETALQWHRGLWIGHAACCIAFFVLLPWQFFSHMFYGPASWALKTARSWSTLPPLVPSESPGAQRWIDFARVDLIQADACTTCGRCVEVCPATAAGKPLQPRSVVLGIRAAIGTDSPPFDQSTSRDSATNAAKSMAEWVPDESLWSCTTCAACNAVCPVGIDIFGKIVELRRGRVEAGVVPESAERLFDSVAQGANPFGRANSERMNWSHGLETPIADEDEPIELLYWVGCAGSFDPEGQSVAQSMIKVLNHLQVNFRVLGCRERCTGDPARRLGEEGLFRDQAEQNLATFARHGVRKILTHCPHCWNTFRNEYPDVANASERPRWTVQHHTEFLAEQMAQGKLSSARLAAERMTWHDPCYLGRGNGVTEPPRDILSQVQPLPVVDMPRNRAESFCCGAGGGTMWVDVPGTTRVENLRAQESLSTGAQTVVTGCPFCKVMLRNGLDALGSPAMRVRDLAELVVQAEGL
ncbi:MAG: (Fe-S)-binding protein [Planctomycetales bacterium]